MPDFSSRYTQPGVYVEEVVTPLVSFTGPRPTVVAIVGPSIGYRIFTEAVVLTATTPAALTKLGINTGVTLQVAATDGTLYAPADYALVQTGGADAQIGTVEDNPTTIARTGGSTIPTGSTVYVTYRYTDADFHAPTRASDFDDVKDFYGEPLNLSTGEITSPLTLAAKVAFENGASELMLVATTGVGVTTNRAELSAAYAKLSALQDATVVVPITAGIGNADAINAMTDLKTHVEQLSASGLFRMGIIGFDPAVTTAPEVLAAGTRSSRLVLAWPNRMEFYNGQTNSIIEVSGAYLAAAYAGMAALRAPQIPLTKKQVRSFSGIPASLVGTMTVSLKNIWSDQGVAVTELTRDNRLILRHGVTTQRDTIQNREINLVRAKDSLVSLIQDSVERSELVGGIIDPETPVRVKGVVAGALETALNQDIVVAYNNLKVRQRPADLSVIEVKFQYTPAYPLNYIIVSFSVNVTTGETDVIELAA